MTLWLWAVGCTGGEVVLEDCAEPTDWFVDLDGDGHGTGEARLGCEPLTGFASTDGDCDDGDPSVHPSASEDPCDPIDRDCDGEPGLRDDDSDGATTCDGDCDDGDPAIHPGAEEVCNGVDDDCSGDADQDAVDRSRWYRDDDGDGWGDGDTETLACDPPTDHVAAAGDCDDTDPTRISCGVSCLEALALGLAADDGLTALDPCGSGAPETFWCDQTTDGGGWTLAGWQPASAGTALGLGFRGDPATDDFSVDLACVAYGEIAVFNRLDGEWFSAAQPQGTWQETALNLAIGEAGSAFKQGHYFSHDDTRTMGCVNYAYNGGVFEEYACDNDWTGGAQGQLADYAGEYCEGARLDWTWAWSDGVTCSYRGESYSWGFALR